MSVYHQSRRTFGPKSVLPTSAIDSKKTAHPILFGLTRKQLSLIILVVQNSTLVLMMRYSRIVQKPGQTMYVASTAVFLAEILKIVACLIVMRQQQGSWSRFSLMVRREILGKPKETLKMLIPSGLYALQNNLLYVALSNLEAATFQVTYQMKIMSTAIFSVVLLGRSLSRDKWFALLLLMIGVTLVQSQSMSANNSSNTTQQNADDIILAPQSPLIGFIAVVTSCISSGFAGCYFEKILKTSDTSMWVRNIQLGISGALFSFVGMIAYDIQPIIDGGLLQGYDWLTWVVVANQALGGLLVAIVVKYADNILKGFATSLSIIVSGIISIYLFNFQPSGVFIFGALIVMTSSYLYGVNFSKLASAAALGCGEALAVLGFCFEFGLGTTIDFRLAEKNYIASIKAALLSDDLKDPKINHIELHDTIMMAISRLAFLRKYGRPGVQMDRVEAKYWESKLSARGENAIQWIKNAAEQYSCSSSQYCLGTCYYDGIGVSKSEPEAFKWYKRSAKQGNCRGQSILGYCYGEGHGVEKDEVHAMEWYKMAAAQGESVAVYNIGYCYEDGIGVAKNPIKAVTWYKRAAELGNAFAQNSLGYCYEEGNGIEQDKSMAATWYKKSADQGYIWAQCNIGFCFQNGIGVSKDASLGAYWYSRAAVQGHARAQHNLGFCYQNGIGVEKNLKLALMWYHKAADQGNIFAYHSLGFCYQNGLGVAADPYQSFYWYKRSAENNHAPAQLSIGFCFRNGVGVQKNEKEAVKWFRFSAVQDNALAQNSLGFCYEEGIGIEKDLKMAVYWYMRAAKQNNPWAQCNLGFCYSNGIGIPENQAKAVYWYHKAAQQNHARAQDKLGLHLQSGTGCRQNLSLAVRYFRLAAEQGHISAQYHLAMCYEKGLGVERNMFEALQWFESASLAGCRNSYQHLVQLVLRYFLESESFNISRLPHKNSLPSHWISGFAAPAA
ncbi:nucleotide-sugar transporter-domain-containing protein [Sporodiniella umbellata]|nr:nucleotide-sugar transporter-domain-containing protein [Sporodiniella umbellata]